MAKDERAPARTSRPSAAPWLAAAALLLLLRLVLTLRAGE